MQVLTVAIGKYADPTEYLAGTICGSWAKELAASVSVAKELKQEKICLFPLSHFVPGHNTVLPEAALAEAAKNDWLPCRPEAVLALAEQWNQPREQTVLGVIVGVQGLMLLHSPSGVVRREGRSLRVAVPAGWQLALMAAA